MRAVVSAPFRSLVFSSSLATLCTSVRCLSLSELAKAFADMSESNMAKDPTKTTTADDEQRRMAVNVKTTSSRNSACALNMMNEVGGSDEKSSFGGGKGSGGGVVTFSVAYSNMLGGMSGPQFALLLERECKRHHYGHMLQCLVEVWRRLRKASPMDIVISDEEARGIWENGTSTSPNFRTDGLLEHVLCALAKTNIDEVQQSSSLAEELRKADMQMDWRTELSCLLLQWLTARVASMSPSRSVTLLHFIGQQKAFHCDAILETLRDNIEVYLTNYPACQQEDIASVDSFTDVCSVNAFDLGDFAKLFDAIARWQMDFVRLIATDVLTRQRQQQVLKALTATITRQQHPILNASFYDAVVNGLLRGICNGSLHLTRHGSPSTFFFLTLALAKIRWFRADCAELLLPQLHEALRVFPGQFLGVLLFLGRREVKVCRCETTDLLLQTLLDAMQKRGQRYVAVDVCKSHQTDGVDSAALVTSMIRSSSTVSNTSNSFNASVTAALVDKDVDDDEDLQLFSTSLWDSASGGNVVTVAENSARETSRDSQFSPVVFTTSFLDLRSVPIFLDSLNHIMTITLEYCSAQGQVEQRAALSAKAEALYEALLNDTHSGVKSLEALLEKPGLVEKLLLSVLRIPCELLHPFLVELAYVFTRHVCVRRVTTHSSNETPAVSPRWQGRAMTLVELLVRRGVITPDTFIMTDDVVSLSPRVTAAVEAEKRRLLEKHLERQNKQKVQRGNQKKSVRTAEVFARFSRNVRQMKQ